MSNTRSLAVKSLSDIEVKKFLLKQAIDLNSGQLDKRDRAFLMEIVYGVLRYRDALDWILKNFLKKPSALGDFTRNNLRAALYQIYYMRVPDWAVVNEAVEIEKASGKPSLVNAVLRNVLKKKHIITLPVETGSAVSRMSINTSHPEWLIRRWIDRFGKHEASLLSEANNTVPPFTIRTNTLRTTRDELLATLSAHDVLAEPTVFSPEGITVKNARTHEELAFAGGLFLVQDEASQLVSHLLGPRPGERVLDACAAPGGKTTHIAQLMNNSGVVVAAEKKTERIHRLKENINKLGITCVDIINADATELPPMETFDRILLDAPCSATGVIRRNPDVKYRNKTRNLPAYKSRQAELLSAVSKLLKTGGVLVYSVCSTEPDEGEDVVNEFLKTDEDFRIIDAEADFSGGFTEKGFFRTYPHKNNMDGFFGAILCRTK